MVWRRLHTGTTCFARPRPPRRGRLVGARVGAAGAAGAGASFAAAGGSGGSSCSTLAVDFASALALRLAAEACFLCCSRSQKTPRINFITSSLVVPEGKVRSALRNFTYSGLATLMHQAFRFWYWGQRRLTSTLTFWASLSDHGWLSNFFFRFFSLQPPCSATTFSSCCAHWSPMFFSRFSVVVSMEAMETAIPQRRRARSSTPHIQGPWTLFLRVWPAVGPSGADMGRAARKPVRVVGRDNSTPSCAHQRAKYLRSELFGELFVSCSRFLEITRPIAEIFVSCVLPYIPFFLPPYPDPEVRWR